LHALQKAE
jgi:hypothetical protein